MYYVEVQQIGGKVGFSALHTELIRAKYTTFSCNGIFCVETRRSSTENKGKRPDARKIGTQKLLPRIRARHHGTCGHINKLDSLIIHNHNLHKIIKTGEKKGHTSHI